MSDINPFAERPVYKEEQVITQYDLNAIRNGFIYQRAAAPWWQFEFRYRMKVGIGVIETLFRFLENNKRGDH